MLKLNPKQEEYIRNANRRWNLKIGAVRSGKTFVDVAYVILARLRAVKDESGLNVILGVSKETIESNVLQPMRELYTEAIVGYINSRNIAWIGGVPVYCLGAEKQSQIAKIRGKSIKYCYGDEIAEWNRGVFTMLESRLDKAYSKFDGACNPESPSHWLKEFIEKPGLDAYIQKYTIFDNPALSPDFVENLCNEYAGTVYYKRYILGEWALAEGLIYPMYEHAIEAAPEGEPQQRVLSIDYGTMNAFAAIMWEKHGAVWYAAREYYYSGRDTGTQKTDEEYAQELDKFTDGIGDEWQKIRTIIDPSAASFIALLRKRKKYHVLPADNAVLDGIRETATCLQTGKIKISPECKSLIKELQGYVWDENSTEDRPVKVNDHACDAMRYFAKTMNIAKPRSEYVPIYMR